MALRLAGALFGFAGGLALVNFFDNQVLPGFDLVSGEVASSVDLLIIGDVPKRVQVLLLQQQMLEQMLEQMLNLLLPLLLMLPP